MRPFRVLVSDSASGEPLLELHRPFRFIFHRLEVHAAADALIGAVQKRWSWFRRIYSLDGGSACSTRVPLGAPCK